MRTKQVAKTFVPHCINMFHRILAYNVYAVMLETRYFMEVRDDLLEQNIRDDLKRLICGSVRGYLWVHGLTK